MLASGSSSCCCCADNAVADGNANVADSSEWHGMRQSLYCIPASRKEREEFD